MPSCMKEVDKKIGIYMYFIYYLIEKKRRVYEELFDHNP